MHDDGPSHDTAGHLTDNRKTYSFQIHDIYLYMFLYYVAMGLFGAGDQGGDGGQGHALGEGAIRRLGGGVPRARVGHGRVPEEWRASG